MTRSIRQPKKATAIHSMNTICRSRYLKTIQPSSTFLQHEIAACLSTNCKLARHVKEGEGEESDVGWAWYLRATLKRVCVPSRWRFTTQTESQLLLHSAEMSSFAAKSVFGIEYSVSKLMNTQESSPDIFAPKQTVTLRRTTHQTKTRRNCSREYSGRGADPSSRCSRQRESLALG